MHQVQHWTRRTLINENKIAVFDLMDFAGYHDGEEGLVNGGLLIGFPKPAVRHGESLITLRRCCSDARKVVSCLRKYTTLPPAP